MANLQKTLDALQPYVIGIRYLDGFPVVDAVFKEGWTVPESDVIEKVKGNEELNYYMVFSKKDGIGLDELLDYVDIVIKANIEREKKHELLKEKVNELKEVFKKNSLTKLKRLKFSFLEEDLVPELTDFDIDDTPEPEKNIVTIGLPTNLIPPSTVPTIEYDTPISNQEYDEDEAELIAEEARAENYKRIKEANKKTNQVQAISSKVELPPKRTIQEALYNNETDCDCGPNEACEKCIEHKDL